MRWSLPIVALTTLACSPGSTPADERALHALLNSQAELWTAGDLEGFVEFYAQDAIFMSPTGETRGRGAILTRYIKRYREDGATMGTLRFDFLDTQLSKDRSLATVALRWHIDFENKEPATGHALVTLVQVDNQWRIQQDASM